ncbi:hypothetical protein [Occultella gossypii]|uniref:ABC transporter permease n=1 Tax=Occultella gossypii TaxID=2800820 RepID=A0ABS7S6X3_9MICO|nr:hypothetical protein [Occultella gossypii]MBZ2195354.1 hypothetical protein [Occultella gossypii]
MINQLRADLFTQRHSTGFIVCLLAACGAAAAYLYLQHQLALGGLNAAAANGVQGLSDVMVINLLGSLLIGLIVSRPFETKSVHDALLASSRGSFVASKTVVAALAVFLLGVPYGIAALVGRATGLEVAPAVPTTFALLAESGAEPDAAGVGRIIAVSVVAAILYAARLAVCIPLAIVVKRPIVVMAAGFVWAFVADLLVGAAAKWEALEAITRLTPYAPDHLPLPDSSGGELVGTSIVAVVFIALMGLVAWLLLRRADIK